jgi:enoyl-CoA hydratase
MGRCQVVVKVFLWFQLERLTFSDPHDSRLWFIKTRDTTLTINLGVRILRALTDLVSRGLISFSEGSDGDKGARPVCAKRKFTMEKELVNYRVEDGIAVLQLNDPPANTYSFAMMQQLDAAILQARMDDAVHVMVLRGDGEKFFCAGANIDLLSKMTPTYKYYFCLHANETLSRLEQTPKLVIAALNGHCVGGGLEVALAADVRLAAKGAGKLGFPEVSLGVLPGTGGTQRLARILGRTRAIEFMSSGKLVNFEDAKRLGLISEVYERENFWGAVTQYAREYCPPHRAAKAVGHIKRSVISGLEMSFHEGLALERELQQELFESEDAEEGLSAYLEKRKPVFTGK